MAKNMPQPQQDPEDARAELMATLAASRELGPEMDKALVDSYIEKNKALQATPAKQSQAVVERQGLDSREMKAFAMGALGLVAYIVLLIVSGGHLWWTFWLLGAFGWCGWGWGGGWGGPRRDYYDRREDRLQRRAARHGYTLTPRDQQQRSISGSDRDDEIL